VYTVNTHIISIIKSVNRVWQANLLETGPSLLTGFIISIDFEFFPSLRHVLPEVVMIQI